MLNKKILLVGHITESYGAMQALSKYLRRKMATFLVITHPFNYSGIPNSTCLLYKNGDLLKKFNGPKYKTFSLIHFLGDIIVTFYFLLRSKIKFDIFIGCDCLNAFTGIVFRWLGLVRNVIFYECDYTPERFKNRLLNAVYHWLNGFAARHADVVWNNPPNLEEIRVKQGSTREKNLRVPHGVDLDGITHLPLEKVRREVLVYAGHVTKPHGLQLLVEALPKIIDRNPKIEVWIIGSGPYETTLKKMIVEKGLVKYFRFFGYTDHNLTLQLLPTCGIGLAPYVDEKGGTFRYCDPLKVKDYLACGLPVIVTTVPACAYEIKERKLGIAIKYDPHELSDAIMRLLTDDEFYQLCKNNVLNNFRNITWKYIYDEAFKETTKRFSR